MALELGGLIGGGCAHAAQQLDGLAAEPQAEPRDRGDREQGRRQCHGQEPAAPGAHQGRELTRAIGRARVGHQRRARDHLAQRILERRQVVPGATLVRRRPDPVPQVAGAGLERCALAVALPAALLRDRRDHRAQPEALHRGRSSCCAACTGASPASLRGPGRAPCACFWVCFGGAAGFGLALLTVAALLYSTRTLPIADAVELVLRPLDWAVLAGMAAGPRLLLMVAVARATAYWQLRKGG